MKSRRVKWCGDTTLGIRLPSFRVRKCFGATAGFLVVLLLCGCIPQKGAQSEDVRKKMAYHYEAGLNYLNEGKTPQAVKELLAAQAIAAGNADVEHALGLAYQQKGLVDGAIAQYKKALQLNPKLTEARNNLGTSYLVKGMYDEAIAEFQACLKDHVYETPEKAEYNLGIAHFHKKDIDRAIQHYEKAVLLKGDNILALHNLGFCYETKKDYPRALSFYAKAIEIDPRFKDAYLRIGLIREDMKEYDQALRSLRRAVEIDPEFMEAQFQLGALLTRVGKVGDGLKKLELVTKADPSGPLGKKAAEKVQEITADKFKGIPKVTSEK